MSGERACCAVLLATILFLMAYLAVAFVGPMFACGLMLLTVGALTFGGCS